jgi:hypothetical protein
MPESERDRSPGPSVSPMIIIYSWFSHVGLPERARWHKFGKSSLFKKEMIAKEIRASRLTKIPVLKIIEWISKRIIDTADHETVLCNRVDQLVNRTKHLV